MPVEPREPGETKRRADITRLAVFWRGMFIQRYAGVEFTLADIVARCSLHPDYSALGLAPWGPTKKLKRLRRILEMPGALSTFSAAMMPMVDRFEAFEPVRHFLAHGLMVAVPGTTTLSFTLHDHLEGKPAIGEFRLGLDDMKQLVDDIQPVSTEFTSLAVRIYREVGLPDL